MAYRKLVIGDDTWEFIAGKEGVKIRSPKGKCTWVRKYELFGLTEEKFETIIELGTGSGALTKFFRMFALTFSYDIKQGQDVFDFH